MKKVNLSLLLVMVLWASCGQSITKIKYTEKDYINADRVGHLSGLLKTVLDNYHYHKIKYDDALSKKAFEQFLKKIDYGKQFLLQGHVNKLLKYKLKMDDQLLSGHIKMLNITQKLVQDRLKIVENLRKHFFSKKFKFQYERDEYIETEVDKRNFMKTEKEFKNYWRKSFKQAVIVRYLTMLEEQNERIKDKGKKKKDKKKKKIKKQPILSKLALRKKAKKSVSKKYKRLFQRLQEDDKGTYLEYFFNSITNSFDPHTVYMPPKRKEDFDIEISGSLEGIGAVLSEDESYIKVIKILPGGPAWKGRELEADDKILAVAQGDGESVDLIDMRVGEAVRYIRGKKGTIVKLTVKKADNTIKVISITRDVVPIAASFAKSSILHNKKLGIKVGYIMLPKFYRDFSKGIRTCTADVKKELIHLKKKGIDGVILDLRNNGGGALEDARTIAGLFFKSGPVVQVKDVEGKVEVYSDKDGKTIYDGPVIVMTNHLSASASEIVAGALQDYGRAIIVGGKDTHGKGSVQAVLDLNRAQFSMIPGAPLGALKVTTQKFYRVTGGSTQFKGIIPDIFLPDQYSYAKNREMNFDNALPWDEIDGKRIRKWTKHKYNLAKLKKRSASRIKKDKNIDRIKRSLVYLIKRRDETKFPLKLSKVIERDKMNKKLANELQDEKPNKVLQITDFEESLEVSLGKLKSESDKQKWKEDLEERTKEWIEGLQKDAVLIETVNIMKDYVDNIKKQDSDE